MEHGSGARISSRFDADSSATRGTNMSTAMNDLDPHSASQAHLPRHSPGQEHDGSASKEDGEDSTAADSKQVKRCGWLASKSCARVRMTPVQNCTLCVVQHPLFMYENCDFFPQFPPGLVFAMTLASQPRFFL